MIDSAVKSVTGDTEIIIIENNDSKLVKIGEWIDKHLESNPLKIKKYTERNLELLELKDKVYIPTTDYDGNVSWAELTAVTRHDPGEVLYEIVTQGGRKVIVTESKSLLVWNNNNNKLEERDTPLINIGDKIPVTMRLSRPPIIKDCINMVDYLPKKEYLYGGDFIKAKFEVENEMNNKQKISSGWWGNNNGKLFTLPYNTKTMFTRVFKRSKIDNIKEGYIYPFSSNRDHTLIPDKFKLDRDNGLFIGLFLAEGCVNMTNGNIRISNNNPNVRNFVKTWFNKYSIKCTETTKTKEKIIGTKLTIGKTTDIDGTSIVLAKFLTKLVGHGSENKHVPAEAFNAPEEFIIGLLDGYFSGDGCVTDSQIVANSVSLRLLNGIAMLCTRLGIFSTISKAINSDATGFIKKLPYYRFTIRTHSVDKFREKIVLIDNVKMDKLKNVIPAHINRYYNYINDIALDPIVAINIIDVKKYPKVYDVTVPSTFNFGLANGLQVRDTAESGYLQRKLVKSMEDIMIKYDRTVRLANNAVVQFVYGDTGADTTKQYEYNIKILEMGDIELKEKYKIKDSDLNKYKISKESNEEFFNNVRELRDILRVSQVKSRMDYKTLGTVYMIPINLVGIVDNIRNHKPDQVEQLEAQYVLDKLEELLDNDLTKLCCILDKDKNNKDSIKYQDEQISKTSFKMALYDSLAPAKCIYEYKLSKQQFDLVITDISNSYNKSIAEAGEMVGVIAAQSCGEPTTQCG